MGAPTIIFNAEHALHRDGVELHRGEMVPCFEHPGRVDVIVHALEAQGMEMEAPDDQPLSALQPVHDPGYLAFLQHGHRRWLEEGRTGRMLPGMFPARGQRRDRPPEDLHGLMGYYAADVGSEIVAGTWDAVWGSARCALTAADRVAEGGTAYALVRPPGHHAGHAVYGGYCFLNNTALAAQRLRERGHQRVAILDVDFHHGNGTQDVFWQRGDVFTVSIHGDPIYAYPYFLGHADETGEGGGEGANLNLPLAAGAGWDVYADALSVAADAISASGATALVVALGLDTFAEDPISSFDLRTEDYVRLGERIGAFSMPTVLVQEGGYATRELGENVLAVLSGL